MSYAKQLGKEAASKAAMILPMWGGGRAYAGPERGLGVEGGYSYLGGLVPLPYVGIRGGGRDFGLSAGLSPIPYLGIDDGVERGWRPSTPRSVYKFVGDRMKAKKLSQTLGIDVELADQLLAAGIKPADIMEAEAEPEEEKAAGVGAAIGKTVKDLSGKAVKGLEKDPAARNIAHAVGAHKPTTGQSTNYYAAKAKATRAAREATEGYEAGKIPQDVAYRKVHTAASATPGDPHELARAAQSRIGQEAYRRRTRPVNMTTVLR